MKMAAVFGGHNFDPGGGVEDQVQGLNDDDPSSVSYTSPMPSEVDQEAMEQNEEPMMAPPGASAPDGTSVPHGASAPLGTSVPGDQSLGRMSSSHESSSERKENDNEGSKEEHEGSKSEVIESNEEKKDDNSTNGARPKEGTGYAGAANKERSIKWIFVNLRLDREKCKEWNLTNREISHIMFNLLKLPQEKGIIDHWCNKNVNVFKVAVASSVDINRHVIYHEVHLREGLSVLPMADRIRKDVKVEVKFVPVATSNDEIKKSLEHFGKVKEINFKKIALSEAEMADPLCRLLENVDKGCGEREVIMDMEVNVPSYILVAGAKAKCYFKDQEWHCKKCFLSHKRCRGRGKAEQCRKNTKNPMKLKEWWEKHIKSITEKSNMTEDLSFECTTVKITGIPFGKVIKDV